VKKKEGGEGGRRLTEVIVVQLTTWREVGFVLGKRPTRRHTLRREEVLSESEAGELPVALHVLRRQRYLERTEGRDAPSH
jgi:hypothetical protein